MKAIDCPYLITNARWGMGVERVDLRSRASLLLWFLTAGTHVFVAALALFPARRRL